MSDPPRPSTIIRGVAAGSVMTLLLAAWTSRQVGGFDKNFERARRQFGAKMKGPMADVSREEVVSGGVVMGAAFGTAYVLVRRWLPRPRPVAGALYGATIWALTESASRLVTSQPGAWTFRPPERFALRFAATGAAVAVLVPNS